MLSAARRRAKHLRLRFAGKQIGEMSEAFPDRRQRGDAVVLGA
jgi:hypothetical protein